MECETITKERFLSFRPLKQDIVHVHQGEVYKRDNASKRVILKLDEHRGDPRFKQILIPDALLFEEKPTELNYFGYKAKYYRRLRKVLEAAKKGQIDLNQFFQELLLIIQALNQEGMLYWDFHDKNILVKNGHPFIIDIDDICLNPDADDETHQREYLTEFILNTYLECCSTIIGFKSNKTIKDAFSQQFNDYLNYTLYRSPEHILPYKILEELKDKDKVEYVKRKIKEENQAKRRY